MGKIIDGTEYKTVGSIKRALINKNIIPGHFATVEQIQTMVKLHELQKVLFKDDNMDIYTRLNEKFKAEVSWDLYMNTIGNTHPADCKYLYAA